MVSAVAGCHGNGSGTSNSARNRTTGCDNYMRRQETECKQETISAGGGGSLPAPEFLDVGARSEAISMATASPTPAGEVPNPGSPGHSEEGS
ncbi:unnamed protein product [Caretta caretta]